MAQEKKENGKAELFNVVSIFSLIGSIIWLYFSFMLGKDSSVIGFMLLIVLSLSCFFAATVIQLLHDIKLQLMKKASGKKAKEKKVEVE